MIEIEAKLRVDDLADVRRRLEQAAATFVGSYVETNHILDRVEGSLRAAGCGLRVRTYQTLSGQSVAATLTFKGPQQPGALKQRRETELHVDDAAAALAAARGAVGGGTRVLVKGSRGMRLERVVDGL